MKYLLTLLVFAIAATVIGADTEPELTDQQRAAMKRAAEFRTFTTTNGTTIIGRPIDYSESSGSLKLLTHDGSEERLELDLLADSDQAFIQDWYSAYSVLDRKRLRIKIDEETFRDIRYNVNEYALLPQLNQGKIWVSIDRFLGNHFCAGDGIQYIFCLENKSGHELNDIQIQYYIYHEAEVEEKLLETRYDDESSNADGSTSGGNIVLAREDLPKRTAMDVMHGLIYVDILSDREETVLKTKKLVSPGEGEQRYSVNNRREIDCEFLGIRYRVYLPTPNGEYAMMEFAEPKSLLTTTEWPSE